MSVKPSIKGTVINDVIEDLHKLINAGTVSREELEQRLRPEDIVTLDQPILATSWYEAGFYQRCSEFLRDTIGEGDDQYIRQRGFAKGKKLIESGLYQQMEYAGRTQMEKQMDPQARFEAYGRDLRLFVSLSAALLNFSRWEFAPDPDPDKPYRYVITVSDALGYPDILGWATEGLIDSMASSHGLSNMWRFERISRDKIVFRMTRAL